MIKPRLLAILTLVALACGERSHRAGEPDVVGVPADDALMSAAIARARSTLDSFFVRLQSHGADESEFNVKARFEEAGQVEHIWLSDPQLAGDSVRGTINNVPTDAISMTEGQRVTVPRSDLSDWMYVRAGILQGGFTIRALRDRLSAGERAEFDAGLPFKVP